MSLYRSQRTLAFALATLAIAAPRIAHAEVIFTNLGFDTVGWAVGGPTNASGNQFHQEIAGVFTTGANRYNNIVFDGAFRFSSGTNGLTFRLHQGGPTVPDESQVLATSASLLAPSAAGLVTWTLDPTVTLAANTTYWISARATHTDGLHSWRFNTSGDTGFAAITPEGVGPDWVAYNGLDDTSPAFQVTGSVVPEPSEWAAMGILGVGLVGLVARQRRKV